MKDKNPSTVYYYILILFVVFSVVNWLPILNSSIIRFIKYVLFIYIFFYEIRNFGYKFPSDFLGPKGLILIFISMLPGFMLSFNYSAIVDVLIPFLFIWIFNFDKQFYYRVIYKATLVVATICILNVISNYTGFFNIQANGPWRSTFGDSGFGGYRTGYSNSLFLFIPFLVFWHRVKLKKFFSYEMILILAIIAAQYVSGGRAGLLSSIFVVIIWLRIPLYLKLFIMLLVIVGLQSETIQSQLRVVDYDSEDANINKLSSGRIFLNDYYFSKFLEEPLFGYGFGAKPGVIIMGVEAHIVWLRSVINGGIIYLTLLIIIFVDILIKIRQNIMLTYEEKKLFYSIFFSSLIINFFSLRNPVIYFLRSLILDSIGWFKISG